MPITREDIFYAIDKPAQLAGKLNDMAKVKVVAGSATTINLVDTPTSIVAVLAVTTATGAVASKFLLAPTTDYTIATNILTCVTDQSANTLIVIYK